MTVEQQKEEEQEDVRNCPKCNSRLWNVVEYSAVTGLFHLLCSDCKYIEIKEWVFTNPNLNDK
jgi:predicted  nucleic acid-binding Zn ribbon protein